MNVSRLGRAVLACAFAASLVACSGSGGGTPDGGTGADGGVVDDPTGPYTGPTTAAWTASPTPDNTTVQPTWFATHHGKTFAAAGMTGSELGIPGGGLFVTSDDGATWTRVTNLPAPDPSTTQTEHHVMSVASDGSRLYAASDAVRGIIVSDDDGATWSTVPAPGGMNASGFRLRLFSIDGKLWAGRPKGGAYVSADKGATWITIAQDTGNDAEGTTSFASAGGKMFWGTWTDIWTVAGDSPPQLQSASKGIPFPNGSNQLIAHDGKLFSISTTSSIRSSGDLYVADPTAAMIQFTKLAGITRVNSIVRYKSALFAFKEQAPQIEISTDDGVTWKPFDQGLETLPVGPIGLGNGYLYAATPQKIWRTPLK